MRVAPAPRRMSLTVRPRTTPLSCRRLQIVDLPARYPSHRPATPACAARAHRYLPLLVCQLAHRPNIQSPRAVSRSSASARLHRLHTDRVRLIARAPLLRRLGQAGRSTRTAVRRRRVQDHRRRLRSPCKREIARSTSQVSLQSLAEVAAPTSESSSTRSGDKAHRACPRHWRRTHRTLHNLMHTPASHPVVRRSPQHRRNPPHP